MMDSSEQRKIQQLMTLPEEALLSLLPAYVGGYDDTMFSPEGQLAAGKRIFDQLKGSLIQKICIAWKYCEKKGADKYQDPAVLVASLSDLIAAPLLGIPPFVVAVLVVKIGLSNFCDC
jgi:hypothetical protein